MSITTKHPAHYDAGAKALLAAFFLIAAEQGGSLAQQSDPFVAWQQWAHDTRQKIEEGIWNYTQSLGKVIPSVPGLTKKDCDTRYLDLIARGNSQLSILLEELKEWKSGAADRIHKINELGSKYNEAAKEIDTRQKDTLSICPFPTQASP